jgi:hypothetical protein
MHIKPKPRKSQTGAAAKILGKINEKNPITGRKLKILV